LTQLIRAKIHKLSGSVARPYGRESHGHLGHAFFSSVSFATRQQQQQKHGRDARETHGQDAHATFFRRGMVGPPPKKVNPEIGGSYFLARNLAVAFISYP
jgi:hypothetical protein